MAAVNIVTGAFGFSGKRIARRLLALGEQVRTLTNHSIDANWCEVAPLDFRRPLELAKSMEGAAVLYNTYWVRFEHDSVTHDAAVENSKVLIRAAEQAGVKRIVHVSITNPSPDSSLPYFRGKAAVEELIQSSSLSFAILRPAVLFGEGDILLNNIAWLLRRFPVFAIPGDGKYGLQPIFVEDLADLAVGAGHAGGATILDAVGPETYQYATLVDLIKRTIGSRSKTIRVPSALVAAAAGTLGLLVKDVVLTKDEVRGLMANLLVSKDKPTGTTRLSDWLLENRNKIGREYASELRRHYR
jgi:uncharacterized protein YbjT (DUF2867 family)